MSGGLNNRSTRRDKKAVSAAQRIAVRARSKKRIQRSLTEISSRPYLRLPFFIALNIKGERVITYLRVMCDRALEGFVAPRRVAKMHR